jgi:hypothetical protein
MSKQVTKAFLLTFGVLVVAGNALGAPAELSTVVPNLAEPDTMVLVGSGLLGISSANGSAVYDNGGRRASVDRRKFSYDGHIPERRSGPDRRSGLDRRCGQGSWKNTERRSAFRSD